MILDYGSCDLKGAGLREDYPEGVLLELWQCPQYLSPRDESTFHTNHQKAGSFLQINSWGQSDRNL